MPSEGGSVRTRGRAEIVQLTGLRGIAALTVAMAHFPPFPAIDQRFIWFHWHNAAVDLFFCLSAFTLGLVYGPDKGHAFDFRSYCVARLARIYPLYAISMLLPALLILAGTLAGDPSYSMASFARLLAAQLLLVNAWPIIGTGLHWVMPAWSVSIEAFCYLLIFPPLFLVGVRLVRIPAVGKAAIAGVLMLCSVAVYLRYWDHLLLEDPNHIPASAIAGWVPILRGILAFLAGGIAYFAWAASDGLSRFCARWVDVMFALFIGIFLVTGLDTGAKQSCLLLAPFLILGLMRDGSVSAYLLSSMPMRFLGRISYSLYLWHIVFWLFARATMPDFIREQPFAFSVLAFMALIAYSTLSYRTLEEPMRLFIRQKFARHVTAPATLPQ